MRKQQGVTLMGMLFVVICVVILGILLMRIAPVYVENYEVRHSINALHDLQASNFSTDSMSNVNFLRDKLMNQFTINGLYDIKPEQIRIVPSTPGVYLVSIHYVVMKPLVYNISLIFEFNESEEVIVGPK